MRRHASVARTNSNYNTDVRERRTIVQKRGEAHDSYPTGCLQRGHCAAAEDSRTANPKNARPTRSKQQFAQSRRVTNSSLAIDRCLCFWSNGDVRYGSKRAGRQSPVVGCDDCLLRVLRQHSHAASRWKSLPIPDSPNASAWGWSGDEGAGQRLENNEAPVNQWPGL